MTNPALDAYWKAVSMLTGYGCNDTTFMEPILTGLLNAPEAVTVEEFDVRHIEALREFYAATLGEEGAMGLGKYLAKAFPNGLKITAAPNGGA